MDILAATDKSKNLSPIITCRPPRISGLTSVTTSVYEINQIRTLKNISNTTYGLAGTNEGGQTSLDLLQVLLGQGLSRDNGNLNSATRSLHDLCKEVIRKCTN